MFRHVARKLTIGLSLVALVTPVALASVTGTDPEPGVVHVILKFLGLA
jgi:hypothetical protein